VGGNGVLAPRLFSFRGGYRPGPPSVAVPGRESAVQQGGFDRVAGQVRPGQRYTSMVASVRVVVRFRGGFVLSSGAVSWSLAATSRYGFEVGSCRVAVQLTFTLQR